MPSQVRVRFAPSPTGYLHVGGARTALFNWLFARHYGGRMVLRIEDTDFSRSSEEMVEGILEGMRWLGLDWDEGPHYQSRRLERYREFAADLLAAGKVYRCFCSAAGEDRDYREGTADAADHSCPHLDAGESARRAGAGEPCALRFGVPPGRTVFEDGVFGRIEVDHSTLEDFVLLRSDGVPTYHLGVVVDDLDMAITHVIRGADHISNTPKQILLYQAAGRPLPVFAHLPLILGPDKQRLSKRHGATSVMAYAEAGYLPEAFFNFLSLLGWSPGDDREILDRRELVSLFTLAGVGRANAVFGTDKLDWFNGQYLRALPAARLRALAEEELKAAGVWGETPADYPPETLDAILELLKSRVRKASDWSGTFRAFFTNDFAYDPAAAAKFLSDPGLGELVAELEARYRDAESFTLESTEEMLRALASERGVKAGLLINAARVGLTGQGVAPGLFEVMLALGKERTLERLGRLARALQGAKTENE